VSAPLPQQQFAPVPPVQPTAQVQAPPWAAQPATPVEESIDQKYNAAEQDMILGGLRNGAPADEIIHWFPKLTFKDLDVLAQRNGLPFPDVKPQLAAAQQQAQQVQEPTPPIAAALPPIAALHAPAAAASAAAGIEQEALAQRVTKKTHHPLIEAILRQNPAATAEQIAAHLKIPLEGTKKAMKEIQLRLGAEQVAGPLGLVQPELPAQPTYTAQAAQPQEPTKWARLNGLFDAIEAFSRDSGYSYLEIESAAVLLGLQSR
jgi:hypothetical protein